MQKKKKDKKERKKKEIIFTILIFHLFLKHYFCEFQSDLLLNHLYTEISPHFKDKTDKWS